MSTEIDSPNRSGCRTPVEQMAGFLSPACADRARIKRMINSGLDPTTEPCLPGDISLLSSRLTTFQIEASIKRALERGFTREELFGPNAHRLLNEFHLAPRVRNPRLRIDGSKDYSRVIRNRDPQRVISLGPIEPIPPKPSCSTAEAKPASKKRGGKTSDGPKRKTRVIKSTYNTRSSRLSKDLNDEHNEDDDYDESGLLNRSNAPVSWL